MENSYKRILDRVVLSEESEKELLRLLKEGGYIDG